MNWLTALIQALGAAISSALSKPAAPPERPAPAPREPMFAAIDAVEDARVARDRASVTPVTRQP